MKKYLILTLVLLLAFTFTACGGEEVVIDNEVTNEEVTNAEENTNEDMTSEINDKYVEYSVNTACEMLEASQSEDPDAVMVAMQNAMNYADYSLTEEEVEEYRYQYEDNTEFALLVYEKMQETCGDTMTSLGVTEYTPQ